jgi:hypothetical protein
VQDVLDSTEVTEYLSSITPDLKSRLVDAEIRYRTSGKGGFTDAKVAHAMNMLAKKIGAPAFAFTDALQVRQLRMKMVTMLPALFGTNLKVAEGNGRAHVRPEMSPIESVCLLVAMVEQKFYNPEFQLSPAERAAKWAVLHRPHTTDFGAPNDRTDSYTIIISNEEAGETFTVLGASGIDIYGNDPPPPPEVPCGFGTWEEYEAAQQQCRGNEVWHEDQCSCGPYEMGRQFPPLLPGGLDVWDAVRVLASVGTPQSTTSPARSRLSVRAGGR